MSVVTRTLRASLDAQSKTLIKGGIGARIVHKDSVTPEDEERLWSSGIFNTRSAKGLSYIVFFYNCKLFGFRGKDEHCELETSQFSFGQDERKCSYMDFYGRTSKTVTGAFSCNSKPKVIRQFEDKSNPLDVVSIYEQYINCLSTKGRFYRRPLAGKETRITFSVAPVGKHYLDKYMQNMFDDAGIDWRKEGRTISNHSGKVYCCTSLYQAGYDTKSIKSHSGHKSDSSLAIYSCPSNQQLNDISNTLQPTKPSTCTSP